MSLHRIIANIKKLAEDNTPFYGIMGRLKNKGKMKPFDYDNGKFVTNIMYQTLWPDKEYV